MKTYTLNEWKETDNYLIAKWFNDLKIKIEKMFENDTLNELEFDYFEYDASRLDQLYIGQLFFNESEYQYKLTILVDYKELEEIGDIEKFNIKFDAYDKQTDESIASINRDDIQLSEFNENYIIEIISDFKTEYIEDKIDIEEL